VVRITESVDYVEDCAVEAGTTEQANAKWISDEAGELRQRQVPGPGDQQGWYTAESELVTIEKSECNRCRKENQVAPYDKEEPPLDLPSAQIDSHDDLSNENDRETEKELKQESTHVSQLPSGSG
jgi:hypothetical protein